MKFIALACLTLFVTNIHAQNKSKDYLLEVISIMKSNSVNRAKLDWASITSQALDSLNGISSKGDAQVVIQQIIKNLGDSHSQFVPEEAVRAYMKTYQEQKMSFPFPKDSLILKRYAYLTLPAIGNLNNDDWKLYVSDFYKKVQRLDRKHLKAWIIDVRNNDGGMFVPMFKAIEPFITLRNVIGSKDNSGQINYYNVESNEIKFGQRPIGTIAIPAITLRNKNIPIYILTSKKTASSGEFITAAFVGQKNVRIVGRNTQGLTSDNSDFKLSDGSILILSTGTLVDRMATAYSEVGKGIAPDIRIQGDKLNEYIEAIVKIN